MARLWRNDPAVAGGCKYLVTRRDGTIPEWPWFVLGARDPHAPAALRKYADECEAAGDDPAYVADIRAMAAEWEGVRKAMGSGDPSAPRHRQDDPATVAKMLGRFPAAGVAAFMPRGPGVEAIRWLTGAAETITSWLGHWAKYDPDRQEFLVTTPLGAALCRKGDWIVKGLGGAFAVMPHHEFEAKYAPTA